LADGGCGVGLAKSLPLDRGGHCVVSVATSPGVGSLSVVAPHLIDPECNGLVLGRVLTLDHQYGDAVDKEDDILSRAVLAIVRVELLGHLEDVLLKVFVVDKDEVQLTSITLVVEGLCIAQVGKKVTVSGNVCMKSAELANQRARRPRCRIST